MTSHETGDGFIMTPTNASSQISTSSEKAESTRTSESHEDSFLESTRSSKSEEEKISQKYLDEDQSKTAADIETILYMRLLEANRPVNLSEAIENDSVYFEDLDELLVDVRPSSFLHSQIDKNEKQNKKRRAKEAAAKREIADILARQRETDKGSKSLRNKIKQLKKQNKDLKQQCTQAEDFNDNLRLELDELLEEMQGPMQEKVTEERTRAKRLNEELEAATRVLEISAVKNGQQIESLTVKLENAYKEIAKTNLINKELVYNCQQLEEKIDHLKITLTARAESEDTMFKNLSKIIIDKNKEVEELKIKTQKIADFKENEHADHIRELMLVLEECRKMNLG